MSDRINKVVQAYMAEYFDPLNKLMYPDGQMPYYPEQEKTYTDLTQLDSQHGDMTFNERYKFVYPGEWTNPDWAGGDFQNPYVNDVFKNINQTPNNNETLYGIHEGSISDLGIRTASVIDSFFSDNNKDIKKISSGLDLTEFLKVSDDTLVHKSTQDLWEVLKDKKGNTYIKRLFDDGIIQEK